MSSWVRSIRGSISGVMTAVSVSIRFGGIATSLLLIKLSDLRMAISFSLLFAKELLIDSVIVPLLAVTTRDSPSIASEICASFNPLKNFSMLISDSLVFGLNVGRTGPAPPKNSIGGGRIGEIV